MGFATFIVHYVVPKLSLYLTIALPLLMLSFFLEWQTNINKIEFFYNWQWVCCIGFSCTNVIFLYLLSKISKVLLLNFFATEILFYFIVLAFQHLLKLKKLYISKKKQFITKSKNVEFYVYVLFFLEVLFFILKYKFLGVRSFSKQGGGTGLILRLQWVIIPLSTYSIIYYCFTYRKKKSFLLLFIKLVFMLFSNSRSSILTMFLTLLLFYFLNPQNIYIKSFIKKYLVKLILISIAGALTIIMLMSNGGSLFDAIITLVYRFIAFGDCYVWAYPNDALFKSIGEISLFHYLSADFLSTFRFLPRSYGDAINISGKLVEYIAGPGIPEGPNARFNVVGLACFGYGGSILFAILCAVIFVLVHYCLVKGVNKSYKVQLYTIMIFTLLKDIQQDVTLLSQFFTEFTIFIVFMIGMQIIEIACKYNISDSKN